MDGWTAELQGMRMGRYEKKASMNIVVFDAMVCLDLAGVGWWLVANRSFSNIFSVLCFSVQAIFIGFVKKFLCKLGLLHCWTDIMMLLMCNYCYFSMLPIVNISIIGCPYILI